AIMEIAEIMVGAHLPTVHRVFFTHALFDKRVARFGLNCFAAISLGNIDSVPNKTRVMDDFSTRIFNQESFRQQADDVITVGKLTLRIEEIATIKISIPSDAHIGLMSQHSFTGYRAIFD